MNILSWIIQLISSLDIQHLNNEGKTNTTTDSIHSASSTRYNRSSNSSRHRKMMGSRTVHTISYITAVDFLNLKQKRPETRREELRGIAKECCKNRPGESCSYHEQWEVAEEYRPHEIGWEFFNGRMCEVSIRENHNCNCGVKGRNAYLECGSRDHARCPFPCVHGTFYCSNNKCIQRNQVCDNMNDCRGKTRNGVDELGCKISNHKDYNRDKIMESTTLRYGNSCPDKYPPYCDNDYYGNVELDNLPICDKDWGEQEAKVICRMLKYLHRTKTKAFATTKTKFGYSYKNRHYSPYTLNTYRRDIYDRPLTKMTEVECKGHEDFIGDCDHKTLPVGYDCGPSKYLDHGLAGVICVDASTLTLSGGSKDSEGVVKVIGDAVCYEGWTEGSAQVVCNSLFLDRFRTRSIQVVPVWSSQPTDPSTYTRTSISNVKCVGTEDNLSLCPFDADMNCPSRQRVYVKCAKCAGSELVAILQTVQVGKNSMETRQSAQAALNRLKDECFDWDCSVSTEEKKYPEFCKVKAALERAVMYMNTSDSDVGTIQTSFDHGDLLNHAFMKESLAQLVTDIDRIGKKVDSFQRKLAKYFEDVADFDKSKAENDWKYAHDLWKGHERDVEQKTKDLADKLNDIFITATTFAGVEIFENTLTFCLVLANQVNPGSIFGKGTENALDLKEAAAKLINSGAAMAEIGYAFINMEPKLDGIRKDIIARTEQMKKTYSAMKNIIEADGPLTEDNAEAFLTSYEAFTPSVTREEIANYHSIASVIINTACDAIKGADTVAGATVRLVAAGLGACPQTLPLLDVLTSSYESSLQMQFDMVESLAQIARATIAKQGAISLSETLGSNLDKTLNLEIAKMESRCLLQLHREDLVREACSYITYAKHGAEIGACANLKENPDPDLGDLISYNYHNDMCTCSGCTTIEKFVQIPAAVNTGTKDAIPPGTIDLTALYRVDGNGIQGTTNFQIPDRKWLRDNKWISEKNDNGNPLFLRSLQLFVPPGSSKKFSYSVHTSLQHSGRSTVKRKDYELPRTILKTEYKENTGSDRCTKLMPNAYNIPYCDNKYDQVCIEQSPAYDGPVYPALVGSSWNIRLFSESILTKPYPAEKFFLQAFVRFCKKEEVTVNAGAPPEGCCRDKFMVFNNLAKSGEDHCQRCTLPSFPRMYGNYCELCPAGFELSDGSFGCTPCPKGQFKSEPGIHRCARCFDGETTITTGQTKCIKVV